MLREVAIWITVHRSGASLQGMMVLRAARTEPRLVGHDAHVWVEPECEARKGPSVCSMSKKGYVKRYDRVLERMGRLVRHHDQEGREHR